MGSVVKGRVEYDENTLSKSVRVEKDPGSEFGKWVLKSDKSDILSIDKKFQDRKEQCRCQAGERCHCGVPDWRDRRDWASAPQSRSNGLSEYEVSDKDW